MVAAEASSNTAPTVISDSSVTASGCEVDGTVVSCTLTRTLDGAGPDFSSTEYHLLWAHGEQSSAGTFGFGDYHQFGENFRGASADTIAFGGDSEGSTTHTTSAEGVTTTTPPRAVAGEGSFEPTAGFLLTW